MKPGEFYREVDQESVVRAIASAEKLTSGEIRVVVTAWRVEDPVKFAQGEFLRNKMDKTKNRNAVLILIAPASRNFAVIGDEGVHAKCGPGFWNDMTEAMSALFKEGNFTEGLVQGIEKAGQLLATHFPLGSGDINELPDDVIS